MKLKSTIIGLAAAAMLTSSVPNPASAKPARAPQKPCSSMIVKKGNPDGCSVRKKGNELQGVDCDIAIPGNRFRRVSFSGSFLSGVKDEEVGAVIAANMVRAAEGTIEREGCAAIPLAGTEPEKDAEPPNPAAPPKAELPRAAVKAPELGELAATAGKPELLKKIAALRDYLNSHPELVDTTNIGTQLTLAEMGLPGNPPQDKLAEARGYLERAYALSGDLRYDPAKVKELEEAAKKKKAEEEAAKNRKPTIYKRNAEGARALEAKLGGAVKQEHELARARNPNITNGVRIVLRVDPEGKVTEVSIPNGVGSGRAFDQQFIGNVSRLFRGERFVPSAYEYSTIPLGYRY